MKYTILFIFCLICSSSKFVAQQHDTYELKPKTEAWITGATLPLTGLSIVLDKKLKPLTSEQIALLDAEDVNAIDKSTTDRFNLKVAHRSDWTLNSSIGSGFISNFIAPAIYPTEAGYGKQMTTLGIIWLETNLVNYTLTELSKTIVKRSRPYLYGNGAPEELKLKVDSRKSFFSGHTSFTAANSFYIANIITGHQKYNQWNPVIWGVASLPPLLVAIQRVRAGKHFPTDVAVGYLVGAACGILIPKLHETDPLMIKGSNGTKKMQVPFFSLKMIF
ncbi:MAG: phosphatase PAP2 family protein [Crocinitomicaceae bacterium]